ncbi:ChrR family anti-sigma-E factor [Pseudoalteromonas arctica]|uniref:Transcriptional regulator n=1 Tax=Pseudoalteromonas arctica TaxID=394751 RepID=A0A7Y0DQJ8_9GAMM|nr:ChrR family anti-sigma-E factor [Pseudoalteromonas arctica]NMM39779.1 transcriptional regulator [Pseudoalteromonas arctica]
MIKHHPSDALLAQYCNASLASSISVAVAIHLDMCSCCKDKVKHIEAQNADAIFTQSDLSIDEELSVDAMSLFDAITASDDVDDVYKMTPQTILVNQQSYQLPRALARIPHGKFMQMGKLSRSRISLEDGSLRSSLLHIDAGGEIPEHTHTGFELTLLLDGEFGDEDGDYVAGDFMWLDGRHQHTPTTKEGCLCYTVVSSALHFNKGLSKLLNPIGNLIY